MNGCRTPPDVVSSTGGCRCSQPQTDSTPRCPPGWTQRTRDDRYPDYTMTSFPSMTSRSPLTSSTPEWPTSGKPARTAKRLHVDFQLDGSDVSSGDQIRRPSDLDVAQQTTNTSNQRRPTKSMILIGEDDVDDLFQPVNINGDSFALLQTPASDRQSLQRATQCQQAGIILSVEALQCMLAKLAGSSSAELQKTAMPPTFSARCRRQLQDQSFVSANSYQFTDCQQHVSGGNLRPSRPDHELEHHLRVSQHPNVNNEQDLHDVSECSAADDARHVVTSSILSPDRVQQQQQQRMRCSDFTTHHEDERTRQRVGGVERSQTVTTRRRRCVDDPRLRVTVADVDYAAGSRYSKLQPPRHAAHHLLPGKPSKVTLNVSGRCSLYVAFSSPVSTQESHHVTATRYCVEWSYFSNFSRVVGSQVIEDPHAIGYDIQGLEPGNCYFVRVRAGNDHGFGCAATSTPQGATPSNWRDFEELTSRHEGKQQVLDDLMETWTNSTASSASSFKNVESSSSKVRKTFKSLFTSTVKLQKTLRRGLFLAALVHHEGRILLTSDDVVPIVDVDSEFSSTTLSGDLYWLIKVASSSWYELKSIEQRLTCCSSSQSLQFRARLLHALQQLQSALGIHNLGQFHYAPVTDDASGATLLVCVRSLDDAKAFDSTHVHWMSLKKAQMRCSAKVTSPVLETDRPRSLLDGAHDMIVHRRLSGQTLPRGLYVGLLQLTSTRDSISVVVSRHQPNVLPYVRVRDNPNVTREEWRWLVNEKLQDNSLWLRPVVRSPTAAQKTLQDQLNAACCKLLTDLGKTEQDGREFRLYDLEVLELNNDVSFILVLPPVEAVCNSPFDGQHQTSADYSYVPVQVFEILNLQAYQPDLLRRYCQLSVSMETAAAASQHELRQALSTADASAARRKVDAVMGSQRAVEDCWKTVRWLADTTTYARDRNVHNGLPLGALFAADVPVRREGREAGRVCSGRGSDATASVDSDYHSDISNYSADCHVTRHYQPVLL